MTLETVSTARTRIERRFDFDAVRHMKEEAASDLLIGGAHLGGQALRAGLVDEINLFLVPILVGGGTRALPEDVRVPLELTDERRFGNGMVLLPAVDVLVEHAAMEADLLGPEPHHADGPKRPPGIRVRCPIGSPGDTRGGCGGHAPEWRRRRLPRRA